MTNIRDIASACGVAPNTVSSVLNNKAGKVSAETRERVLRTVREMGYRPRARAFGSERSLLTLGLLPSRPTRELAEPGYYQLLYHALLIRSGEVPFNLLTFPSVLFDLDPHLSVRTYCDGRCDGILILTPPTETSLLSVMQQRGTPFVVMGRSGIWAGVDVNNIQGARTAVEHLLSLGHRRITFVSGELSHVISVTQRREGYLQALAQAGLGSEQAKEVVISNEWMNDMESYRRIAADWQRQAPSRRPTALFCWNDKIALSMLAALNEVGLRVPEAISVVGFDDVSYASQSFPPLTTMRQPYDEIVRVAVETLLSEIQGALPQIADILLPAELIVRASTAPPPFS